VLAARTNLFSLDPRASALSSASSAFTPDRFQTPCHTHHTTEPAVIRFNCPTCGRDYELPDALARLPLVCKKCGQRITPPDPTPEPPLPPSRPAAPSPAAAVPVAPPRPAAPEDEELPLAKPDESPGVNLDLLGPPPPPAKPRPVAPPAPVVEEAAPPGEPEPTMLPFVADLIVFLVLLGVGAFLGELLVGKTTGQVISESGSAPKFPPIDLLVWAALPVVFGLIYLLLGKRGRSVGAWLRRRREATGRRAR
jgi:hypothetical protein